MNELTLTELDMGFSIPKILQASAPTVDHQGRHRNGWSARAIFYLLASPLIHPDAFSVL